jgi:hypothetical protein
MQRPTRLIIAPAMFLLCGLAGCVVEGPPPQRVVVERERPAPPPVVVERPAPPPGYYRQP